MAAIDEQYDITVTGRELHLIMEAVQAYHGFWVAFTSEDATEIERTLHSILDPSNLLSDHDLEKCAGLLDRLRTILP